MQKNSIGLYIHIPFCDGKCFYCDFFSENRPDNDIDKYVYAVCKKINEYSNINRKIDTVYFGGGTPSIIGEKHLGVILDEINNIYNLKNSEVTVEVNPSTNNIIDFEYILKKGVNRLSIGLQSANDNELKLLGRRHTAYDCIKTVKKAKLSGFNNISIDLMLGIPEQTTESLKYSVEFCNNLDIQHISAYILKIEDNTFFGNMDNKTKEKLFFDDDKQSDFYELCCKYLSEFGYNHYEISNFSRQGMESKHNLKYWNCDEYIGIGASAHSFFNGKRFYTPNSFEGFYNNISIDDGLGGSRQEYAMLRLRLKDGINNKLYYQRFNCNIPDEYYNNAKKFQKLGLTECDNNGIRLTEKGFLLSNALISEIILY